MKLVTDILNSFYTVLAIVDGVAFGGFKYFGFKI